MTDLSPYLWALLAACCWGVAPLVEKIGLQGKTDPGIAVFVRSVGVLIGMALMAAATPKIIARAGELSLKSWTFLIMGGILASILGQLCFYRALKFGEMSRVVPIGAAYPVLAFLLGILFLHESVTATKVAGLTLVMAGVYLLR